MGQHPELHAEQAFIDRAYDRLETLRATAREMLQEALTQRGGTFQAVEQREVMVNTTLHRLSQLDIGRESLIFGRIDREDGEDFHIGRLAVSAEDQEPLVVDWRAPVAEPFYRATGRHPMGLTRRRHFASEGRKLLGIEDEVFSLSGAEGNGHDDDYEPVGTSALLAALERSRSGQMRDIVATVQKEQDEVIRAELPGVLVVQGGPGTGKTAVALHRAAYLLYTYRFPLERQGVLVVGPNPLFLRYIGQVLPSLGESGVVLTTIEGLVGDVRARGVDSPVAARVKGEARMARVVARAVRDRQRPLRRDVVVGYGPTTLRLTVADSEHIVAQARRRPGSHNARRRMVETLVTRRLQQQYAAYVERTRSPDEAATVAADEGLGRELRRMPDVAVALDRMWPVLLPEELLHDLYGAPPLIALAGRGVLLPEECEALARPRSSSLDAIPWTAGDLPLLDEARVLLGTRKPSPDDEVRAYGHIVVDEAQDLTPMQLRMLNRRSISGSMTVVGDIAQATGHRAPSSWDDILEHLPSRRPPRVVELSVNYRTPAEIMALAGRVLAEAAPGLRRPQSVRSTEMPPRMVEAAPGSLAAAVAEAVREEAGRVGAGTRAVICPPSMRDSLAEGLRAAGLDFGDAAVDGLDEAVTLVPVDIVKGLEFDGVVVVEPSRIVEEAPQGLRALYVALTRSTKVLTVVHTGDLPGSLS